MNNTSPTTLAVKKSLAKRYAAEKRFRFYGVCAIAVSILFLFFLLGSIFIKALPAFSKTDIQLSILMDAETLGVDAASTELEFKKADYAGVIKTALYDRFPDVSGRKNKKRLRELISTGAQYQLQAMIIANPDLIDTEITAWFLADDEVDSYFKTYGATPDDDTEVVTRLNDEQQEWVAELNNTGDIRKVFNTTFFTSGDSREPELAGIVAALKGSAYTLLVTFLLSFPIAVMAAIYLEEFAPVNKWTDLIEVNINNLAAVPSIVFGLLGLAVFINIFELPRSAPLVGGLVLSLMTLPTIIIASRAALKAVPPSIREAALGLGASRTQVVFHHVLPLAMPGILTGTIIGLAQALGETAPLLMIGMVAFIVDVPQSITDAATVLPVQIFLWADSPERAFTEKTSAAIITLLVFLVLMNALAVLLRKKFERRW